jgi:hypothetical protein
VDPSHFVVGGLTAITVGLLIWIELRSRRNAQENKTTPAVTGAETTSSK